MRLRTVLYMRNSYRSYFTRTARRRDMFMYIHTCTCVYLRMKRHAVSRATPIKPVQYVCGHAIKYHAITDPYRDNRVLPGKHRQRGVKSEAAGRSACQDGQINFIAETAAGKEPSWGWILGAWTTASPCYEHEGPLHSILCSVIYIRRPTWAGLACWRTS